MIFEVKATIGFDFDPEDGLVTSQVEARDWVVVAMSKSDLPFNQFSVEVKEIP